MPVINPWKGLGGEVVVLVAGAVAAVVVVFLIGAVEDDREGVAVDGGNVCLVVIEVIGMVEDNVTSRGLAFSLGLQVRIPTITAINTRTTTTIIANSFFLSFIVNNTFPS